jgi:hypothetical protein
MTLSSPRRGEQTNLVRSTRRLHLLEHRGATPICMRGITRRNLSVPDDVRSLRNPRVSAVFALDDPVPGLHELRLVAQIAAQRVRSGRPL